MPASMIFWMLMILWLVFGLLGPFWYPAGTNGVYLRFGGELLLFIVIALLGWKVFGRAIQ